MSSFISKLKSKIADADKKLSVLKAEECEYIIYLIVILVCMSATLFLFIQCYDAVLGIRMYTTLGG